MVGKESLDLETPNEKYNLYITWHFTKCFNSTAQGIGKFTPIVVQNSSLHLSCFISNVL